MGDSAQIEAKQRFKPQADQPADPQPQLLLPEYDPGSLVARASLDPGRLSPPDVLRLQRLVGNRAVSQILAASRQGTGPIQAKLTVGAAGDRYEQEADRVAEQVVSESASHANQAVSEERQPGGRRPGVQRQEEEEVQAKPLAAGITPIPSAAVRTGVQRVGETTYIPPSKETSIAREEESVRRGAEAPWVEYGNIYLSVTETSENSWKPIVAKRFAANRRTHFWVFSGTHGEANGYVINREGLIDEQHRDPELYAQDQSKRQAILEEYDRTAVARTTPAARGEPTIPEITVVDVFGSGLRKPADLKAMVEGCSSGDDVAILAWCYSVQALTQAEGEYVRLLNALKTRGAAFVNSLPPAHQKSYQALNGMQSFAVDTALEEGNVERIRDHDRPIIERMVQGRPASRWAPAFPGISPTQHTELDDLLQLMEENRRIYQAQKAVPLPDIMAKWAPTMSRETKAAIGAGAVALAGAGIGAFAGSFIGGFGAVPGAIIGGLVGAAAGGLGSLLF